MGQVTAVRKWVVSWALAVSSVCLAAGLAPGLGSAHSWHAATSRCFGEYGQVTLRLKPPTQTVRVHVGDTIKVIVDMNGDYMHVPRALNHKQAVCRVSWHRVSAGKVIAVFLVRRIARRITFQSYGQSGSNGCPPDSHGCPHPVAVLGYAKIRS